MRFQIHSVAARENSQLRLSSTWDCSFLALGSCAAAVCDAGCSLLIVWHHNTTRVENWKQQRASQAENSISILVNGQLLSLFFLFFPISFLRIEQLCTRQTSHSGNVRVEEFILKSFLILYFLVVTIEWEVDGLDGWKFFFFNFLMQLQQATEHCMVLEGERASMFHTNNWKWELCTTSIQASRRNSIEIQIWHFHRHHSCAHHVSLARKIQQMLSCCCWRWQGKWIKFATRSNRQRDCVHSLDCKRILSLLNHS